MYERTRVETTVAEHVFRTSGRVLLEAGWKAVYGEEPGTPDRAEDDSGGDQMLPKLEQGEAGRDTRRVESLRKETQPPRRFTDASLLGAMETAGKDIDDAELREAMKDSGIGTPATRAAIIERLINVGYVEREGRALVCTDKGIQVIKLLGEHQLTSPELTGEWEHRLGLIERGEDSRPVVHEATSPSSPPRPSQELDKLKGVQIERAKLGPCPVCGREITENRKGYSCWSKDDPGCGFVIWKKKASKSLPVSVAKELIESLRASREAGEDPASAAPPSRSPASAAAPAAASAPSSSSSRTTRASGGSTSTRSGPPAPRPQPPAGESEEEKAEAEAGGDGATAASAGDGANGRARRARPSELSAARALQLDVAQHVDRLRRPGVVHVDHAAGPVGALGAGVRPSSADSRNQLPVFQRRVPSGVRQPGSCSSPGSGPCRCVWPKITCSASMPRFTDHVGHRLEAGAPQALAARGRR